jgi:hypothetical protein
VLTNRTISLLRFLETAIKLNWTSPEANVDGSKPANILGYNVYASAGENEARLKISLR